MSANVVPFPTARKRTRRPVCRPVRPEASTEAWMLLADAYADALGIAGLPDEHRGLLLRQLRRMRQLAGLEPFDEDE
jgi:hypothetical protein